MYLHRNKGLLLSEVWTFVRNRRPFFFLIPNFLFLWLLRVTPLWKKIFFLKTMPAKSKLVALPQWVVSALACWPRFDSSFEVFVCLNPVNQHLRLSSFKKWVDEEIEGNYDTFWLPRLTTLCRRNVIELLLHTPTAYKCHIILSLYFSKKKRKFSLKCSGKGKRATLLIRMNCK